MIFDVIFVQSCKAGLVICAILLFCVLLGKRLSPATRYAIWLLVPLTLLLCVSVPTRFSVWNILESVELPDEVLLGRSTDEIAPQETSIAPGETLQTPGETLIAPDEAQTAAHETLVTPGETLIAPDRNLVAARSNIVPAPSVGTPTNQLCVTETPIFLLDAKHFAIITWLIGCIAMTLVFIRQGMICRRWLRRAKLVTDSRVLVLFEQCVQRMNARTYSESVSESSHQPGSDQRERKTPDPFSNYTKTWLVVAESPAVSGAFLIGVIRPTLLLPARMARHATDEQLLTVFLHELAHLKRWDIWTSWLMTWLLIVHWFNPFLWLAIRRMNADREEACDALALAGLDPLQRKNYGRSLVDITEQFQSPTRMPGLDRPGLVGISEDGKILTRRIEMIRQMGTWKTRWALLAALFAVLLGAITLTDAQQPLTKQQIRSQIEMLENDIQKLKEAEKVAADDPSETASSPFQAQRVLYSSRGSSESRSRGTFDDFFGKYVGLEGDQRIAFELYGQNVTRSVPETRDGQIYYVPVTETLSQIAIYKNGFPNGGGYVHEDDWYAGSFTLLKENELTINLFEYQEKNKERKPIPEVLKNLTAKIIRDGENITLEIPKNDEWDAVRVTKANEPDNIVLNGIEYTPVIKEDTVKEEEKQQPAKPLLVQGKTFAQWREVFQPELDPKFRTEALRAMALFGANGYGKEATEAILEVVTGLSFESLREVNFNHLPPYFTNGRNPIEEMKFTAVNAFISKDIRITPTDFVPILVEKLSSENTNEQLFAFLVLNNTPRFAESELYSLCYDKFMQWDINDLKAHAHDKSPSGTPFVLLWVQYQSKNGEMVIKYLRETIQNNDEFRFQFYFAHFQPLEFDEQGRMVIGDQHGYGPPMRLSPRVADGSTMFTTETSSSVTSVTLDTPQLTVFGRSLLALLREEGIKSDNAAIRTTSQQVVDALTQIEALGEENPEEKPTSPPTQKKAPDNIVKVYVVQNADPKTALAVLQTMLAGTPDVRLSLDPKTNNLIVLGNEAVHAKVRETLNILDAKVEENSPKNLSQITLKPDAGRTLKVIENVVKAKEPADTTPSNKMESDQVSDAVWNFFGIRVEPVKQEEYQRRTEGMVNPYVCEGAVEILEVKPDSIFGTLKMQKGDLLIAIITPNDAWHITRISDLKYFADRWTPEELGGIEVKVVVIRGGQVLEGKITVKGKRVER